MRILYVALKYDYGRPERGLSFEHWNFYESLREMGHDLIYFDFATLLLAYGRDGMNRRLSEVARTEAADVMFTLLFEDELDSETVRGISDSGIGPTVNWFADDHWRFELFSRRWAPSFDWVVTTASSALPKYQRLGYDNVIKSQWACNPHRYRPLELALEHDVTFVGQPHGSRRRVIEALGDAGIDVKVWGRGWDSGRLDQRKMIEVFSQSRINLNLSNAGSQPPRDGFVRQAARRGLGAVGLLSVARSTRARLADTSLRPSFDSQLGEPRIVQPHDQIKGRNFEVPGCGGFLLTGPADNLDEYYEPGQEVVVFQDFDDLVGKINHYLANEDERVAIARAGYERTLGEHTWAHRFTEIFSQMGLPVDEDLTQGGGMVLEVD